MCAVCVCRYRKVITDKTYLDAFYVTSEMADKLLPQLPLSSNVKPASAAYIPAAKLAAGVRKGGGPSCPCTPLFKVKIMLYDSNGRSWRVQYDGLQFNGRAGGQRHLRLTRGWRLFVRGNDIRIGRCLQGCLQGERVFRGS